MSKKGSVSNVSAKNEGTGEKCMICSKVVSAEEKGIGCEICSEWQHAGCAGISKEAYKFLAQSGNTHWYCDRCNKGVAPLLEQMTKMQVRQDKMEQELTVVKTEVAAIKKELQETGIKLETAIEAKLLAAVDNEIANKVAGKVDDMHRTMSDSLKSFQQTVTNTVDDKVKNIQRECTESLQLEKRRKNIVIHGVKESESSTDSAMVYDILSKGLKVDPERYVEEVTRIGQKKEQRDQNKEHIRPIRVKVKNVEGKIELLKRAKLLKDEGYERVFLQPDLTLQQQELDKKLRDELKRLRSAGETNIKIKAGKIIKNEEGGQVKVLY